MNPIEPPPPSTARATLKDYFGDSVREILRPAQGHLKHPYLVPGGLYDDELWDWDSFWIVKGIAGMLNSLDSDFRETVLLHSIGSWKNFMENQAPNGTIPIMLKSDNPDFFNCAQGDIEMNQAKPVFGQFALEISRYVNDFLWIEPYFARLMAFYDRWRSRYRDACGLLVWGSDVAIGVDNDPATWGRPEFSSATLLLNCLYYQDLLAAADIADALHREPEAKQLRNEAHHLGIAVQRECWDPIDGFFYSVDVQCKDRRDHYFPSLNKGMDYPWNTLQLKIKMFTGFLPMWCGIATESQAQILVERSLKSQHMFQARWGIPSMAKNESRYLPEVNSANPSNWLGPVWIVSNYLVYEGLKKYGYQRESRALAAKITSLLKEDFSRTGTLHECYHPDTGSPNFNAGFLSWNILVLLMDEQPCG